MKVLFVSSGNSGIGISPLVKAQGESLKKEGVSVTYFTIQGNGLKGYLGAVSKLRSYLKSNSFDLLHAHYGLSAMTAFFGKRNLHLVVSFMGDDVMGSKRSDGSVTLISHLLVWMNRMMARFCYDAVIVKSEEMKKHLRMGEAVIIPNGVNCEMFYPEDKVRVRKELQISGDETIVLFVSDPARPEKNFSFAQKVIGFLDEKKIRLQTVYDESQEAVRRWMNAADVLVLTSYHEGSPNVIKEAMACNCPIVSTDVGDVKQVFGDIGGCFIGDYEPDDFSKQLEKAIDFSKRIGITKGRERILELELDSKSVARQISKVYKKILQE